MHIISIAKARRNQLKDVSLEINIVGADEEYSPSVATPLSFP